MDRTTPIWKQRAVWTGLVGLAALAFWVVGIGAGWRAWILGVDAGIVAKAQQFGTDAHIWWIPAAILTLTAVTMATGIAIVRQLAGGVTGAAAAKPTVPEKEALPTREPAPPAERLEPADVLQEIADDEGSSDPDLGPGASDR